MIDRWNLTSIKTPRGLLGPGESCGGSKGGGRGGDGEDKVPITCSFQALRPSELRSCVKVEVAVLGSRP